jgi:hypothetical protein
MDFGGFFLALGPYSWLLKLICLTAFILLMVTVVAWLYSGEIQNTEIGPLALRGSNGVDIGQLFGPKAVVTNVIDGKKARCEIWINYRTRGGVQAHKKLWTNRLQFGQVGRRYSFHDSDLVGYWNKNRLDTTRAYLTDAGLVPDTPNMFAESGEPFDIKAAIKDTEYEVVCLSKEHFEEFEKAHTDFIEGAIRDYTARKTRTKGNTNRLRTLHSSKHFQKMPDLSQESRIYARMRFDIYPWYALSDHPDREVKTTAWLTVLTSLFAMFMQVIYNGFG